MPYILVARAKIESWKFQHLFDLGFRDTKNPKKNIKFQLKCYLLWLDQWKKATFNLEASMAQNLLVLFLLALNIIIWVKTLQYFTQTMIFSPNTSFWTKKCHFTTWERELEEKVTTNSVPILEIIIAFNKLSQIWTLIR